jgi:hypothetical protein
MNKYEQQRARERAWAVLIVLTIIALAVLLFANRAQAYNCTDSGEPGWFNGTTADDTGCVTEAEYIEMFSIGNLTDSGVLVSPVDNGNGTVTGFILGGEVTLNADPLSRPVAATPRLEPDAPTVGEVLYPATANRLAALIG